MGDDDETSPLDSFDSGDRGGLLPDNQEGLNLPGIKAGRPCFGCMAGWAVYTGLVAVIAVVITVTILSWRKYGEG